MVSRNTALVPSLGLRIGPAYEAGLGAGMRRERVSPQIRKKERNNNNNNNNNNQYIYKQRQSHAMSQRRWLATAVIFRPSDMSLGFAET